MTSNAARLPEFDSSTPDCPHCEIALAWDQGDRGDRHHPPEPCGWSCGQCGQVWGCDGPDYAEYEDAAA